MANSPAFDKDLKKILETSLSLVTGDRAQQHGNAYDQHSTAAALWSMYLHARGLLADDALLKAHDVAQLMLLLKVSRDAIGSFNPDTFIDQAGYAALSYAIKKMELEDAD
jgi:Domain of unknown function (DUF6378)